MSSEKLVDAIGLLDDKMIYDARFSNVRKNHLFLKITAAVLVLLIIPASMLAGDFFLSGHIGIECCQADYSYKNDKLLKICRIDVAAVTNNNTPSTDIDKNELYGQVGTGIYGVVYADDEKVVFTTRKGIFVYNYQTERIVKNFDLDEMGAYGFNQGDEATYISVDISGDYAVLESSDNISGIDKSSSYRLVNLKTGTVDLIEKEDIPDNFTAFETKVMSYCPKGDFDKDFNLPYAWCGDIMASYTNENGEQINFYTNIEPDENGCVIVGNTELVIAYPDNSFTTQRVFADMFPEFKK